MRIDHSAIIEEAIEGILLWCAGIVRDLDPARAVCAIIVDVEVGGFIKAVQKRSDGGCCEIVVYICITIAICGQLGRSTCVNFISYTVTSLSSC